MRKNIFKILFMVALLNCIIFANSSILISMANETNTFTVQYFLNDDTKIASSKTTIVNIGTETPTLTTKELAFNIKNKVFIGWKVYRESDECWRFTNGENEIWAKEKPKGYDYLLYVNGNIVSRTGAPGTTVKLYAQWIDANLDVTNNLFGANGSDKNDDTLAIQKALSMAKDTNEKVTVNIPKGTYYINNALRIYSNTDLILDKDAVIVRENDSMLMIIGKPSTNENLGEYGQIQNIRILGGTWDGNVSSYDSSGGTQIVDLMTFMHGSNIEIKDTTIKECCGYHFIELVGVKDVNIDNVRFLDYIKPSSIKDWGDEVPSETSEVIQIDFAEKTSHSQSMPFDGTVCNNVIVQNCTFTNCLSGIGNHHSEHVSSNIKILNNQFRNVSSSCINLTAFKDVLVEKNDADNISNFIVCNSSNDIVVKDNSINNIKENGIYLTDSTAEISNNIFSDVNGTAAINALENCTISILNNDISNLDKNGIRIKNGNKSKVIGNTISNMGKDGILIQATEDIEVNKNELRKSNSSLIALENCKAVKLIENILQDFTQEGVYCANVTGEITKNDIHSEKIKGEFGIIASNECNLKIDKNNITGVNKDGINAIGKSFEIINNTITNCDRYGIRIKGGKVSIRSNEVLKNQMMDIAVYSEPQDTVEGEITNNIIGEKGINAAKNIKQSGNTTQKILLGDVDGNGKIDAQDAVMILKYVAHNITLTEQQLLVANTTKDKNGTVDAQDAVQILKYVAHNISEF